MSKGSFEVKVGLAEMLKGGVIMDVTDAKQAKIAEDAGAVAVMEIELIHATIWADGDIESFIQPTMIIIIKKKLDLLRVDVTHQF